jgi:uncharacterized protein YjbI with pentapeptide repeats
MSDGNDARRLGNLEKAVNDSANKVAILWTSFITLGAYLFIATGSVKHRDLFLDAAIKLPVLGVDLPVTGYFLFAPLIFLIFHFYMLLQLHGLGGKVSDYNLILNETVEFPVERRLIRRRLDDFPFLQFLAGVRERRTGVIGTLQILISWITVVMFPVAVFLQLQIAFLPYHSEPITWLHRSCLIGDLGLIWFFWPAFRRGSGGGRWRRIGANAAGWAGTLLLVMFSTCLATFPGEEMYRNVVSRKVDDATSFAFRDRTISASRYFFEGDVDGVTGRPSSLFANRIILPGERFYDAAKKTEISVSLRGRDLRGAVLPRSDLSFADFTGATLVDASFGGATLQRTRFGCAAKLLLDASGRYGGRTKADSCDDERAADLRGVDFSEATLHGAFFDHAKLRGARFARAMMQAMSADNADLTAATFTYGRLEGASFVNATLEGVSLFGAQMQGADLSGASLINATLLNTQMQGANLSDADLTNATLHFANMYRAFVKIDDQKETILLAVRANPNFPRIMQPSPRRLHDGQSAPKLLDAAGYKALVGRAQERIQGEDIRQTVVARLQPLDPDTKPEAEQLISDKPIKSDPDVNEKVRVQRVEAAGKLMCGEDDAPYIARAFIFNGRILGMAERTADAANDPAIRMIATLRNGSCPGAAGLDVNDFRELARIERLVDRMKGKRDRDDADDNDDTDEKK